MSFENVKYISKEDHAAISLRSKVDNGDILFAMIGSIGNPTVVNCEGEFSIKNVALFKPYLGTEFNGEYLFQVLLLFQNEMKQIASGGVQSFVSLNFLRKYIIPIPPIEEQKRIVVKINELMVLCDELEAEEKKLDALETYFKEYLPKSILQAAVHGKLVPQNVEDEPVAELLKKVCKNRKLLSTEEEAIIPFDIPDTWKWVHISDIGEIVRGSGIKRTETVKEGFPCVRYGELYTIYDTSFSEAASFIPKPLFDKCKHFNTGDILMTLTGENKPDIAKAVAYLGTDPVAAGGDLAYWTNHGMNPLYLAYLMASPYVIEQKIKLATGDMIVHISESKLGTILIPIPPYAEQNRIVAKIEELLTLCNDIKTAYTDPVAFDKSIEIIPFPISAIVERNEETLLVARGNTERLSADAMQAIDDLFPEDEE